ncbi:MAG: peroxiredoxin [Acidimicrobiales bacterium]|nr:MAG: peroxiredoxin [Acidimicrobiales bacterium]
MAARVGEEAPDFTLTDQEGNKVSLSQFRGEKPVVLVFYPFSFTGVCEQELCSLRDDIDMFERDGVQVLAVSCNAAPTQKRWAAEQGFRFPVLSDFWPHGEVARAYGVFDENLGCAVRATFVIDKDGKIVDEFRSPDLKTARSMERYEQALAKLRA